MKPIETPDTNRIFKLPGGTEENDLPLCATEDDKGFAVLVSTWEPTEEERAKIAEGENIELIVWGMGTPPVALRVTGPEEGE